MEGGPRSGIGRQLIRIADARGTHPSPRAWTTTADRTSRPSSTPTTVASSRPRSGPLATACSRMGRPRSRGSTPCWPWPTPHSTPSRRRDGNGSGSTCSSDPTADIPATWGNGSAVPGWLATLLTCDGLIFTDRHGRVIDPAPRTVTPTGPPPDPVRRHEHPLGERAELLGGVETLAIGGDRTRHPRLEARANEQLVELLDGEPPHANQSTTCIRRQGSSTSRRRDRVLDETDELAAEGAPRRHSSFVTRDRSIGERRGTAA